MYRTYSVYTIIHLTIFVRLWTPIVIRFVYIVQDICIYDVQHVSFVEFQLSVIFRGRCEPRLSLFFFFSLRARKHNIPYALIIVVRRRMYVRPLRCCNAWTTFDETLIRTFAVYNASYSRNWITLLDIYCGRKMAERGPLGRIQPTLNLSRKIFYEFLTRPQSYFSRDTAPRVSYVHTTVLARVREKIAWLRKA